MDGLSDDGTPVLSPDRAPVESAEERQRIREYLDGGEAIQYVHGFASDMPAPGRGAGAPMHNVTDGQWIWSAGRADCLSTYGVAPGPEFNRHIVESGYLCSPVLPELVDRAVLALQEHQRTAGDMIVQWRREHGGDS